MESGTLVGLGIAGAAAVLVVAGAALTRSNRTRCGFRSVIGPALAVALITAFCGAVIVATGTHGYLDATVRDCSQASETVSPGQYCLEGSDRAKQAGGAGMLGGLLAGVVGGCAAAWWRSRSLRMVAGGVLASLGVSVLAIESMVVLVLWAA
jgi:hypothetical protein